MKELFNQVTTLYKYFNGENYFFFGIFILACICIFLKEENKKIKTFFGIYSCLILFIIWNPICIKILMKFINYGSMYRVYFMLPLIPTIAYFFTKLIEQRESKKEKLIFLGIFSVFIVFFGTSCFNENNMIKTDNWYKLPDEYVETAYLILSDENSEYKKAIVPYGMSAKIQQVVPEISLVYDRIVSELWDENGNQMPQDTDDSKDSKEVQIFNSGNVKEIVELCKKTNTNYIVYQKSAKITESFEKYGFENFAQTVNYNIYRLKNDEK